MRAYLEILRAQIRDADRISYNALARSVSDCVQNTLVNFQETPAISKAAADVVRDGTRLYNAFRDVGPFAGKSDAIESARKAALASVDDLFNMLASAELSERAKILHLPRD